MPFNKKYEVKPLAGTESPDTGKQDLHDEAVRLVENQHGPRVSQMDHYDELVADAERQISQAIEANKGF